LTLLNPRLDERSWASASPENPEPTKPYEAKAPRPVALPRRKPRRDTRSAMIWRMGGCWEFALRMFVSCMKWSLRCYLPEVTSQ
jgi:hypothetical protein